MEMLILMFAGTFVLLLMLLILISVSASKNPRKSNVNTDLKRIKKQISPEEESSESEEE